MMSIASARHLAPFAGATFRGVRHGATRPLGLVSRGAAAHADVSASASSATSIESTSALPSWTVPSWDVRVLFDGDCPLCVREVNFLRAKDEGHGKLDLVDISAPDYSPADNRGIDFETAMKTIHGVTPDGDVVKGIEVFDRAYRAVGLGWIYAFARVPALSRVAGVVYDFWAERRLAVTGRPSLDDVMRARRAREAAGGATACAVAKEGEGESSQRASR